MGKLYDQVQAAVDDGRYLIGAHAASRLDERGITDWQIIAGFSEGEVLRERYDAHPNPTVEVRQMLADGTSVKAVWSWLRDNKAAKLVTVYYFND